MDCLYETVIYHYGVFWQNVVQHIFSPIGFSDIYAVIMTKVAFL